MRLRAHTRSCVLQDYVFLSKKKDKPIASIARELIMEAIQGEEDFLLGNIALSRKIHHKRFF
jgi:predicted DNA-binding protein